MPDTNPWQPTLTGDTLALRPLTPDDFEALYAIAADPLIWEQHPDPLRWQRPVFGKFFATALASQGALLILDRVTGDVLGSSRYYDWKPEEHSVAIGFTFLSRRCWGGKTNAELKRLMLEHAFLHANTAWFHVGLHNYRSRRAMEKIGGTFSHVGPFVLNGVTHEHAYYRIDRPGAAGAVTA